MKASDLSKSCTCANVKTNAFIFALLQLHRAVTHAYYIPNIVSFSGWKQGYPKCKSGYEQVGYQITSNSWYPS